MFYLLIICILCMGCSFHKPVEQQSATLITVRDSLGRKITLDKPLTRVAIANAYNTDLTELVTALGCLDTIVGVEYLMEQ